MIDINKAITTVAKTGKVMFGAKEAIKNAINKRAKLIVIASNCPKRIREDVEFYCELSNIPVTIYEGTNIDLGAICGKPFRVSTLTIREPGDSKIFELLEANNG